MANERVPINPDVLAWALDESGLRAEDLASGLKLETATVRRWLTGESLPTTGQWTALARRLKRPRSLFLLAAPPPASVPPALRTAVGRQSHTLRPDELLQVRRARRLQRYLTSLLVEAGERGTSVPHVSVRSDPERAGGTLRTWLAVTAGTQSAWDSSSEAFGAWRQALEARGVAVVQQPLGKAGIRGFAVLGDVVSILVVNTAENTEARTFTLMHELAHIASRTEATCSLPPSLSSTASDVERWCDRVAATVLLPRDTVRATVSVLRRSPRAPKDDLALARRVAGTFKTSLRAAALRLIDLAEADRALYEVIERAYPNRDRTKPRGGPPGGQSAPVRRLSELGLFASEVLLSAFDARRLTERDVRDLLRLDGAEIGELRSLATQSAR